MNLFIRILGTGIPQGSTVKLGSSHKPIWQEAARERVLAVLLVLSRNDSTKVYSLKGQFSSKMKEEAEEKCNLESRSI